MRCLLVALIVAGAIPATASAKSPARPLLGIGAAGAFHPGVVYDWAVEQHTSIEWPTGPFALGLTTDLGYFELAPDECDLFSYGLWVDAAFRARADLAKRDNLLHMVPFVAAELGVAGVNVASECDASVLFVRPLVGASAGLDVAFTRRFGFRIWAGGSFTAIPDNYEERGPRSLHIDGGVSVLCTL